LGAKFGRLGYSSAVVPASVNSARAQRSVRYALLDASRYTFSSGSSRTISCSLRAETVRRPGFATSQGCELRIPTSRSVAASSSDPSFFPVTSSNALARIGIVLRFSTIDWIRPRPRWNSPFSIENFMAGLPPTEIGASFSSLCLIS